MNLKHLSKYCSNGRRFADADSFQPHNSPPSTGPDPVPSTPNASNKNLSNPPNPPPLTPHPTTRHHHHTHFPSAFHQLSHTAHTPSLHQPAAGILTNRVSWEVLVETKVTYLHPQHPHPHRIGKPTCPGAAGRACRGCSRARRGGGGGASRGVLLGG